MRVRQIRAGGGSRKLLRTPHGDKDIAIHFCSGFPVILCGSGAVGAAAIKHAQRSGNKIQMHIAADAALAVVCFRGAASAKHRAKMAV